MTWQFQWQSPDTSVGPISFYASGLASQNSGPFSGYSYSTSVTADASLSSVPTTGPYWLVILLLAVVAGAIFASRRGVKA